MTALLLQVLSPTMEKLKYSYQYPEMPYFYYLKQIRGIWRPKKFLWDTGTELFKTHKIGNVPGTPAWMGSLAVCVSNHRPVLQLCNGLFLQCL
jgi:hypothetical protein